MRKTILFLLLGLVVYAGKAQTVYECPTMGFKFVMDCECFELYINHPEFHVGYDMKMVPLVTYRADGSPASKILPVGMKLYKLDDVPLWNKTPEEIIAIFSSPNLSGKKLLAGIGTMPNDEYAFTIPTVTGAAYSFPPPEYAPVEGGPLLLGTSKGKNKDDGNTYVMYENGDTWYGQVINKVYPDYSVPGGKYTVHEQIMKDHYDKNSRYRDSIMVERKKVIADSIQQSIDAAQQQVYRDSMAVVNNAKWNAQQKTDSVNNLKTARQLIAMMDASTFDNHLICGIGIDIKKMSDRWDITEVEKYSGAWYAGLKVGDQLDFNNNNWTAYTSKQEIITSWCKNMGGSVRVYFSRSDIPGEYVGGAQVFARCLTPYNLPASLTKGGCLTGDCENGTGIKMDGNKTLYLCTFTNGKPDCPTTALPGQIFSPVDSSITTSYFADGKKNGQTSISHGRALISYTDNGTAFLFPPTFMCNFKNDLADGNAEFNYQFGVVYYIKYINGVAQGRALQVVSDKQYKYCDISADYQLSNCYIYDGVPADVSMLPSSSSNTSSNTNPNTVVNNQPQEEGPNLVVNEKAACEFIEQQETSPYTWHDGGALVFHQDAVYDQKYVSLTVPPHKTLHISFVMDPTEIEKVKFLPRHMSYLYEPNLDGGELVGGGNNMNNLIYWQYYTITNNEDKEGGILIEIQAVPASIYFTRTMYYVWGISDN